MSTNVEMKLDVEDRETLLMAAKTLGEMTRIAGDGEPATARFLAEGAYYAAQLVDVARRLERHLEALSRESAGRIEDEAA